MTFTNHLLNHLNSNSESDRIDKNILNLHDLWRSIQEKYERIETYGVEERIKGNEYFSLQHTESETPKLVIIIREGGEYTPRSACRVEYTFFEKEEKFIRSFKEPYNAFFVEGENNSYILVDYIHSLYYRFQKEIPLQEMAEKILGDGASFFISEENYFSFETKLSTAPTSSEKS